MRVIRMCAPTTVCNPKVCNPNVRVYFKVYYVALSTRSLTVNSQLISIQPVYAVSNRDSHDSRPYALSKRVSTRPTLSLALEARVYSAHSACARDAREIGHASERGGDEERRRRGAAATSAAATSAAAATSERGPAVTSTAAEKRVGSA